MCIHVLWMVMYPCVLNRGLILIYIAILNYVEPTGLCITHPQCVESTNELDISCPF